MAEVLTELSQAELATLHLPFAPFPVTAHNNLPFAPSPSATPGLVQASSVPESGIVELTFT